MGWLEFPRCDEPEEIDDPAQPYADLARSMADVARSNRFFGGTHTVLTHVARLLRGVRAGTPIRILDIATGSADIPRALLRWAEWRGLCLTVVGVDNMAAMLRMAADAVRPPRRGSEFPRVVALRAERPCRTGGGPLHLVQADALRLPFAPRSFDIALCALAFHHLGFDDSARVLAAMDALTTRGFVVSDLRRDWPSLWGVQAAVALMRAHPFTQHDGPASVRRAFTPAEYRKMVGLSGVHGVRLYSPWYFRVALVQNKAELGKSTAGEHRIVPD